MPLLGVVITQMLDYYLLEDIYFGQHAAFDSLIMSDKTGISEINIFCRYRMLSRPYAFGCILRLRTSTEFRPGHSVWKQSMSRIFSFLLPIVSLPRLLSLIILTLSWQYGHFFPDPQYENVQHIICCDAFATYAYEFDFANTTGFSR